MKIMVLKATISTFKSKWLQKMLHTVRNGKRYEINKSHISFYVTIFHRELVNVTDSISYVVSSNHLPFGIAYKDLNSLCIHGHWIVLSGITTNHQIGSDTSKMAAQWCVYNVKVWWKTKRRNNFKIQLARQKAIGPSVANVTEVTFRLISFVCNLDRSKSLCAEQVGFFFYCGHFELRIGRKIWFCTFMSIGSFRMADEWMSG